VGVPYVCSPGANVRQAPQASTVDNDRSRADQDER
jgi:hypothetical protein